ncbi:hypothetical protein NDN08_007346 [Rhodosorus marinus]|uniref:Uncharacterized protein n=1 Tax=Rhodosorus marinus TaxID=101924 RepID=A0AAV8UJ78_9RHOD|nr:hypothetical protein NDN08_007346 [Rhodosorus marinus]
MASTADSMVSMNGYFRMKDVKKSEAKTLINSFLREIKKQPFVKFHGFSVTYDDGVVAWNDRTKTAEDCIAHLETISELIAKIFNVEMYERIEVSASAQEIQKLKDNNDLNDMGAHYFVVQGEGNKRKTSSVVVMGRTYRGGCRYCSSHSIVLVPYPDTSYYDEVTFCRRINRH